VPAADDVEELEADREFARVQFSDDPAEVVHLLVTQGASDVTFVGETNDAE